MKWLSFAIYGKFIFCFFLLFTVIISCNNQDSEKAAVYQPVFSSDSSGKKIIILGFPSFSYSETAVPLVNYLNANLPGVHIKIKACVSYEEYLDYLNTKKFDLTLINGIQALEALSKGYAIRGKIIDDNKYSGVIFTRKDARINKIADLKGRRVAFVPSNVITGTMMPVYYLYQNGIDINHDIIKVPVSSFESAIIAAYVGKSEAGLCLTRNWTVYTTDHPDILSKLNATWETPPLINNALLVNEAFDSILADKVIRLFFSVQNSNEGRQALKHLAISGFTKANNDTYKPMMDFKRKYDAAFINIKSSK